MIRLPITAQVLAQAKKESRELGELRRSMRHGEGNLCGILGEILVADYSGATRAIVNYDYDLVLNNIKIDVKSKERGVPPLRSFNCSVPAQNTSQKCDVYAFVSIMNDYSAGWLLGGIPKEDFYRLATFNKAGEEDPTSNTGWRFKTDCYNLPVSKLFLLLNQKPRSI